MFVWTNEYLLFWTQAMVFLNKLKAERSGKKVVVEMIDGILDDDVRTPHLFVCSLLSSVLVIVVYCV